MRAECEICGAEKGLVLDEYNRYGGAPIYCLTCIEEEKHNEWSEFQDNVSFGNIKPDKALGGVKEAFKGEYGDSFADILVDSGVSIIEKYVESFVPSGKLPSAAEFMIEGRKLLSQEKSNSFLAEMALVKGSGCVGIDDVESRKKEFCTNYLSGLVDYSISRDLSEILGDTGISNISKLKSYLDEVKIKINKSIVTKKGLKGILNG